MTYYKTQQWKFIFITIKFVLNVLSSKLTVILLLGDYLIFVSKQVNYRLKFLTDKTNLQTRLDRLIYT